MKTAEIVKALRCTATVQTGDEPCESCPFNRTETLTEAQKAQLHCEEWHSCDVDGVALAAADLIERLEKEKSAAQWISTTERLPEECVPVLINYVGYDGTMHPDGVATWAGFAFLWWEGGFEDCDEEVNVTVTHWMPLPEAPEVE